MRKILEEAALILDFVDRHEIAFAVFAMAMFGVAIFLTAAAVR